jgi:hypothetical protein
VAGVLLLAMGAAEILGRASEACFERAVAKTKKGRIIAIIAKGKLSSLTILALLPSVTLYPLALLAAGSAGSLALALSGIGVALALWWRSLASAIALRAGLARQVSRSTVATPALVGFGVLLVRGTPAWGALLLYGGYLSGALILFAILFTTGLAGFKWKGPPLAMPDVPSLVSAGKYLAASALVFLGEPPLLLSLTVLFDLLMRGALLAHKYWSITRAFSVIPFLLGLSLSMPLASDILLAALGVLGLIGMGFQSPVRCILCV